MRHFALLSCFLLLSPSASPAGTVGEQIGDFCLGLVAGITSPGRRLLARAFAPEENREVAAAFRRYSRKPNQPVQFKVDTWSILQGDVSYWIEDKTNGLNIFPYGPQNRVPGTLLIVVDKNGPAHATIGDHQVSTSVPWNALFAERDLAEDDIRGLGVAAWYQSEVLDRLGLKSVIEPTDAVPVQ